MKQSLPTRVFDAQSVKNFDQYCIENGHDINDLVENAGHAVFRALNEEYGPEWKGRKILVLVGPGLNGADGLEVSKHLMQSGADIEISLPLPVSNPVTQGLLEETNVKIVDFSDDVLSYHFDIVIDAIFGIGTSRALPENCQTILKQLKYESVVAVDLPSGLDCDTGAVFDFALNADITITFTASRPAHFLLPARDYCGKVIVEPLGVSEDDDDTFLTNIGLNERSLWYDDFPWPDKYSHKYNRGTLLIGAGPNMTGASRMAALAAQRVGAGLVALAVPHLNVTLFKVTNMSILVHPFRDTATYGAFLQDDKMQTVMIGPGLGDGAGSHERVLATLRCGKPCVLDADGMSIFTYNPDLLRSNLHEKCILTPHEGEFARIFPELSHLSRIERTKEAARLTGCTILLKGSDTIIASGDGEVILNQRATPFLATAGSGDVLAGLIAGLYAQGMDAPIACATGHWISNDIASRFGPGLIAEDIIKGIPEALRKLYQT